MERYLSQSSKSSGKRPAQDQGNNKDKKGKGMTLRAPVAHAVRTSEKNPGLVTKIPLAAYELASPVTRSLMRNVVREDLAVLSDRDARAKARAQARAHAAPRAGSPRFPMGPAQQAGTSAQHGQTGKVNARGQPIPPRSPVSKPSRDRDGSAGCSFLVSPLSYGRTERATRAARRQ